MAINYQLKNGKTIQLTVEQYLELNDYELESLELYGAGFYTEDPFFDSVLSEGERVESDPDVTKEIPDIDFYSKWNELDCETEED